MKMLHVGWGFSPMLWGIPLMQADLQEALYCGAMDLEFSPAPTADDSDKPGKENA